MSANKVSESHRFAAQVGSRSLEHGLGLLGLDRAFDESGIAAMVEMEPGDLVRLAVPSIFGPAADIELSRVLTGMVEETGAPAPLFGYLFGLAAVGIWAGRAQAAEA